MKTLNVNLGEHSYPIYIGSNILENIGLYAGQNVSVKNKIIIVTNPKIGKLYLAKCKIGFENYGFKAQVIIIPDGEKYKSFGIALKIYKNLLRFKADRKTILVALGGGVIGDLVGFAAATYLRGIPLIQVPTTLLAQVDSSVGGKVAINLPEGKNLVGAFYQPKMVYIDTLVLSTLPIREIRSGLSEVIKYGIISDKAFFYFINQNIEKIIGLDKKYLEKIIETSCKIKAGVVERDEKEEGERAILNFGHTIGHTIEAITKYKKYRHGEAVAIGMIGAMKLAEKMHLISQKDVVLVKIIIKKIGLPIKFESKIPQKKLINKLMQSMELDKKTSAQIIRFVLTKKIGHVTLYSITDKGLIEQVLSELI